MTAPVPPEVWVNVYGPSNVYGPNVKLAAHLTEEGARRYCGAGGVTHRYVIAPADRYASGPEGDDLVTRAGDVIGWDPALTDGMLVERVEPDGLRVRLGNGGRGLVETPFLRPLYLLRRAEPPKPATCPDCGISLAGLTNHWCPKPDPKPEREVVGWRVFRNGFYCRHPGATFVGQITAFRARAHLFATLEDARDEVDRGWGDGTKVLRVTRRKGAK